MAELDAAAGAAGNISVYLADNIEAGSRFPRAGEMELPVTVPHLAGGWVVVTGSGRRLREVARSPETTLCLLHIAEGGQQAAVYGSDGIRPTSEINSHLAVHDDHAGRRGLRFHAVVHAEPVYLSYLSYLPAYSSTAEWSRRLLRWRPELIYQFPEGIGLLPFEVPGSSQLVAATAPALAVHRAVMWAGHGIVARADTAAARAGDLVEYAETAARYEYLNLAAGEPGNGLTRAAIGRICERHNIQPEFF